MNGKKEKLFEIKKLEISLRQLITKGTKQAYMISFEVSCVYSIKEFRFWRAILRFTT